MAQLLDHIEYLSREIGPRPAGTEEEQQSALYIADQLQHESGFRAEIEEFTSSSNLEGARAIPAVVIVLVTILAMVFNVLTIPALVLALVAAAVYALEAFDKPVVSKPLARGASQNVVAKYQPGGESASHGTRMRSRKIVLVAHYDSGKVKPRLVEMAESLGLPLGLVVLGGMAVTLLLLVVRIFIGGFGGVVTIVLNVLAALALVIVALPIVKAVLYRMAPYNEGANNNASGVAALIEVARRISTGSVSEADLAAISEDVVMHGEEAVLESGLVPEDARLDYEAPTSPEQADDLANYTEEERLLAAKAAIAALTGRPVDSYVSRSGRSQAEPAVGADEGAEGDARAAAQPATAEHAEGAPLASQPQLESVVPVDAPAQPAVPVQPAMAAAQAPVAAVAAAAATTTTTTTTTQAPSGASASEVAGFQNAPSWFVAAQRNAKKPAGETARVQRSRYTQAIEGAEREAAERERVREEEERARRAEATRASIAAASGQTAVAEAAPDETVVVAVPEPQAAQPAQPAIELPSIQAEEPAALSLPAIAQPDEASDQVATVPAIDVPVVVDDAPETPEVDLGSTVACSPIHLGELARVDEQAREQAKLPAEGRSGQAALANIPSISASEPARESKAVAENANPSRSGLFRKLRADVPSLSGVIRMQEAGQDVSQVPAAPAAPARNAAPKPAPAAPAAPARNAAAQQPLGNGVDYDMEVPDFGDQTVAIPQVEGESAPKSQVAEAQVAQPQGAEARDDVEIPTSRARGFLSRHRRKKGADLEETPQEWLDVDEAFDARTVGRERGGWESFRNESGTRTGADEDAPARWQGGGFSRVHLDYVDTRSGSDADSDTPEELVENMEDRILNEEIGQIIHFRNPHYNTEVWFVAIGSDTELHDGAKAFVNEHRSELRGAMVVEVESLGAGTLTVATEEGQFRSTKASSRVKRYTRPAIEATGITLDEGKLVGSDSVTTTIQKAGFQAMHLYGAENGKPALKGSADDVYENIDELTLEENVSFLMELLKYN